MRILIATHHSGIIGGMETHVRALVPALQAAGNDVALVHEYSPDQGDESVLDGTSSVPAWCAGDSDPSETVRRIRSWRPDVVYSHALNSPDLEAALAREWPAVLFAHAYYGTCISGTKYFTRPRPAGCRRSFGVPCLLQYFLKGCGGANPLTMLRLYQSASRRRDNFDCFRFMIAGSRWMISDLARNGVADDRLSLAPLFPPNVVRDPLPPALRPRTDRILFVGRIAESKGWRRLLTALPMAAQALRRDLRLAVIGDGPDRNAMESCAAASGVNAEFHGWVKHERVVAEMRNADLLAVPSIWSEPFGLVGVEAGCVGLPSVGYAVGGIVDWLLPGVSGELSADDDGGGRGLADALVRALDDDDYLQRLRVGAWETASNFTLDRHLAIVTDVLMRATVN